MLDSGTSRTRPGRWTTSLAGLALSLLAACASESSITAIEPGSGSARGGQKVTIEGKGFEDGAQVLFGDKPARAVRKLSDSTLEATTPTTIAGTVDVAIKSGGDTVLAPGGFTFLPLDLRFVEAPSHYLPSLAEVDAIDAITADFDRDGHPDLFVAVRGAPSRVMLNSGTGSFGGSKVVEVDAGAAEAGKGSDAGADAAPAKDAGTSEGTGVAIHEVRKALVADFDQDGSPDVFLCNGAGEVNQVLHNDGKGELSEAPAGAVAPLSDACLSAEILDFNKDGRPDVAVLGKGAAGSGRSYVRIYLNDSKPGSIHLAPLADMEPAASVQGKAVGKVVASDPAIKATFTIDQKRASTGKGSGKVSYDAGTVQGTIALQLTPPGLRQVPGSIELDLYGDNGGQGLTLQVTDAKDELFEIDLGAASWTGWKHLKADKLKSWKHSGEGADGVVDLPIKSVTLQIEASGKAAKGELAIDDLTFVLAGGAVAVGEDFERIDFAASWAGTLTDVRAGDVDGDGFADVVVSSADKASGAFAGISLNKAGTASTTLSAPGASRLPVLSDPVSALAMVDSDHDGDLDIVAISDPGQDRLLLNDGTGHFFDDTLASLPLDHSSGRSVSVADVDLDGRPDLIISNAGTVNRLYVNRGIGGFSDATPAMPLHPLSTRVMVPLDVDGDGDTDFFVLNDKGEASKLYISVEPAAKDR
ncbi:MAG: VCBS repeat-containing protein [Deltaproteobacteria bacterium]|nr:VCBS repeat-containing protein [Deltaproteobacteria bacterium]